MSEAGLSQVSADENKDLWEFLYLSTPDHEQLLNQLLQLSLAESLQLCIVGPPGSGKSSLRKRYLSQADPQWHICDINARRGQTPGDILKSLAENADLPVDCGEVALLHLLSEYTSDLTRTGHIPVLIIDDAHLLPVSTLQLVLQLSTESDNNPAPWKLLIFSDQPLDERLKEASHDKPELVHGLLTMNMPTLSLEQGVALFDRLQQATGNAFSIEHDKLEQLLSQPALYPGQIIEAITAYAGLSQDKPAPDVRPAKRNWSPLRFIKKGYLIGLLVTLLLATVLLFQQQINTLFSPGKEGPDYIPPESGTASPNKTRARQTRPSTSTVTVKKPQLVTSAKTPPASSTSPTVPATTKKAVKPVISTPEKPVKPAARRPAISKPADKRPLTTAIKKKPTPVKPVESSSSAKQPVPGVPGKPVARKGKPRLSPENDRHWVSLQKPAHFTLQLLASTHPATITGFIKSLRLPGKVRVYHWKKGTHTWHVAIYGNYPNIRTARKALSRLPKSIRKGQPWPIRFSVIQDRIKTLP